MTTTSRIVVQSDQDGPLEIQDYVVPDPSGHQVVVEIEATGVCQSQVFWTHQPRTDPVLFGHEGYGVVTAVGPSVTAVTPGDHVLVTWVPRPGRDARLPEVSTVELADGRRGRSPNVYTWADHALVDELFVYRLPGAESPEISVAACAVLTGAGSVRHAPLSVQGKTVAVIGAGGVGLSAIAAARIGGAQRVFALDVLQEKLTFARDFGATDAINVAKVDTQQALELMDGGVDLVVDCVASQASLSQALTLARSGSLSTGRGGTVTIVGLPKGVQELDLVSVVWGQKTIVGSLAGGCVQSDLDVFLDWHRSGEFDLTELVTDRYALDDVAAAVDDLVAGRIRGRSILIRK